MKARTKYRTLRLTALVGIADAALWLALWLAHIDDYRASLGAFAALFSAIAANRAASYYLDVEPNKK